MTDSLDEERTATLSPLVPELVALMGGLVCTILIALPLNTLLGGGSLIAPFVEEPAKQIGVLALALYYPAVVRAKNRVLLFGILAGVGFATLENFLYVIRYPDAVLIRAVLPVPMHMVASALCALGVAYIAAQYAGGRRAVSLRGIYEAARHPGVITFFTIGIGIHFLYNLIVGANLILGFAVLAAAVFIGRRIAMVLPDDIWSYGPPGAIRLIRQAISYRGPAQSASSPAERRFCIHCGGTVEPGQRFCRGCGRSLPG